MQNKVFGLVVFNSGWETRENVIFNNHNYNIVVSIDAFFEKDGITKEQENSYKEYKSNLASIMKSVEQIVDASKYYPTLLLFKRNGNYGIIFDDKEDSEGGIVVTIKPKMEIMSVDQYL